MLLLSAFAEIATIGRKFFSNERVCQRVAIYAGKVYHLISITIESILKWYVPAEYVSAETVLNPMK